MTNDTRVVVVGSGFGGLSAAVRMQAAGYQTTILEKRHQLGGRAGVFERDGYTFDTGPTIITPPFLIHDLFQVADRDSSDYLEMVEIKPKYRLYFPDDTHMEYGSSEDNVKEIERLSPRDVEGYKKYMKAIKPVYELGFEKFGSMPFTSIWDMVKMGPSGVKHKAYKSVYGLVSSYMKDERLRSAMSFNPLFIGGNPLKATSIFSLITYIEEKHGMWWIRGGTHKFVDALERLFKELGGQIKLNSEVDKIVVGSKKQVKGVSTSTGDEYDADVVISNADVATTYTQMIDKKFRRYNTDGKYKNADYSMSLFMIYFGVKKKYPEMLHHSIVFGKRYKGLLKDIFNKNIVPEDFSTYLHIPTRTDPEMAPSGSETMYACTPVANLDANIDWDTKKDEYRDHILSHLDERILPGLLDNLGPTEVFTPLDFKREFNSVKGAGFSLQPLLMQSGFFRPHNKSRDIQGLYFVGAGTHPGAGVPSVLMSADITSQLVNEDLSK